MAKQVFDFRPGKGFTVAQSNEHQRHWTDKGWLSATHSGNYDRTRTTLNFEVARGGKVQPIDKSHSIPELMAMNLKARGIKDPNEGMKEPYYRTVVNVILGGGRERMRELAFGDQKVDFEKDADNSGITRCKDIEQWACDMYKFAADRWGEENIVACYVHVDESNPHMHLTLLPIDENQKFAFKKLFAGKDKYEFKARTSAILLHQEIVMAERRVKGLTTMVQNLEKQKAIIETEQKRLAEELVHGRGNADAIREQIRKLDVQLQSVIDGLADKKTKLEDAVQQRDKILSDVEMLKSNRDELRHQVYEAAGQMEDQIRYRLKDAFADTVLSDFRSALPDMSFREMENFNGTMLADMAADGENIMTCALFLYGGMLDDATTFAKGHGGGGGHSDLPWGREEDEDDRDWARRCMMMAHRIMKPSGARRMKR